MDFKRIDFTSRIDGKQDWMMVHDAGPSSDTILSLHGHGSHGDQLLVRADMSMHIPLMESFGLSVISPNYRDNSWMSVPAVADLADFLAEWKSAHPGRRIFIVSGSMGGTGALIFAMRHPELIDGVGALGAATDLRRYAAWCRNFPEHFVIPEIGQAIEAAYTGDEYELHNVCLHADRLTMPVLYYHGDQDQLIPTSEALALAEIMKGRPNFTLTLTPGGHDSPLACYPDALTKLVKG